MTARGWHRLGIALALAGTCSLLSCGNTDDEAPTQLNLDRPVDIVFACYGSLRLTNGGSSSAAQPVVSAAQPFQACNFRSSERESTDPEPFPVGQEFTVGSAGSGLPVSWYGLILQTEPGTIAISKFDTKPSSEFEGGDVTVQDSDPLTPGENAISVGEEPVGIAMSNEGCYAMTANAGTCDMSSLDVSTALDDTPGAKVDRIPVLSGSGSAVRSRPAAMVATPPSGTIGVACPANPTGLVYIAYPACSLVAAVDLASGTIVSGIQFDSSGVASIVDGNVSCPDECDGGMTPALGVQPVALDLFQGSDVRTPESTRLAIGAKNLAAFTVVTLDNTTSLPLSIQQLPLENTSGNLGLTAVALSPPLGQGGSTGVITDLNTQFQYVYGVATDHTVRVADLLTVNKECDTQVDPRLLYTVTNITELSCPAVGDPSTPRRRAGAIGPGIQLPNKSVPLSVSVVEGINPPADTRPYIPSTLRGYFGVITAADGNAYVLNINDVDYGDHVTPAEPLQTLIPLAIANQLRDNVVGRCALATEDEAAGVEDDQCAVSDPSQHYPICGTNGYDPDNTPGSNVEGARDTAAPTQAEPTGSIASNKVAELPTIRQVLCTGSDETIPVSEMSFAAPTETRDLEFPDLRALGSDEIWTLTWEGPLSTDTIEQDINGPAVREGVLNVDASNAMRLDDSTSPFCHAGVEPYDIVQLRGCDSSVGNADCPVGYTCFVHPDSQVTDLGQCMLANEASQLADACKEFLISNRTYSAAVTTAGELILVPRTHVLQTSPVDGCTSDAQCKALADYAAREDSAENPSTDNTPADTHTWACETDPSRAPITGTGKRCLETCGSDGDCEIGDVCQTGTCMESVIPPQACVNAPQRYDLRSSDAFTVVGDLTGYVHNIIADANGTCVVDPSASPFQIGRMPLDPPACDPTADPRTGLKADGTYDINPCKLTVTESDIEPQYLDPTTCVPATTPTAIEARTTTGVRMHGPGMTVTIVDPTYPGDASCIEDRMGNLGNIPLVMPGYQLSVRITAGFTPLLLSISPAFPVKVVRGPTESIWVMDDGDFLSTDPTVASTRGKVFRIETQDLEIINLLE